MIYVEVAVTLFGIIQYTFINEFENIADNRLEIKLRKLKKESFSE